MNIYRVYIQDKFPAQFSSDAVAYIVIAETLESAIEMSKEVHDLPEEEIEIYTTLLQKLTEKEGIITIEKFYFNY